ncbi:MAG TPA: TetR/AcrR family transcriptional regulator [Methylotenera sp.]|nr:TetR/AcrR family transcriptional regulator [Methylotenera sp.]
MSTDIKKMRGRPRVFDMDEALDKALEIFWKRGFEGASIAELTETLGINKPSLYGAFGNKEEIFKKALSRYVAGPVAFIQEVVNQPTAFDVAQNFLIKAVEFFTDTKHPKGCLIVQAALSVSADSLMVKDLLANYRYSYEHLLAKRFEKAKEEGDLPNDANAETLAKFLSTLHQGMSVQVTSGASKAELMEIVEFALKSWPREK